MVEENLKKRQGKYLNNFFIENGENIIQPLNDKENALFQIFLVYMYYLSCLKHESFNPDTLLRTSLFWSCSNHSLVKTKNVFFCKFVYREKHNQINDMLMIMKQKEDFIYEELIDTFDYDENNSLNL